MKILFIGGTGTISTWISRKLLEAGHELTLLNRGNRNSEFENAEHITCDIYDEQNAARLLEGRSFDVVADFIAFSPDAVERDWRLFNGKTKQYIFISSASAYQKPLSCYVITESTPLSNSKWQYSRNKIACEEALIKHYREDGFPVTIVRPSHTYDERNIPVAVHGNNGGYSVIRRMMQGKPVILPGDGSSLWTMTHSRDFADGFIGLLANPRAIGEAVHITNDENLTWRQVYNIIARELGVVPDIRCVPSDILSITGEKYGYDFKGSLIGDKSNTVVFDNSKIKRLVPGFCAKTRYDQGVREALDYISAHPEEQRLDPEFDEYCDKLIALMDSLVSAF